MLCLWLCAGAGWVAAMIAGMFNTGVVMADTLATPLLIFQSGPSDVNELNFGTVAGGGESFLTGYTLTVQSNGGYSLLVKGTDLLGSEDSRIDTENLQVRLYHGSAMLYESSVRPEYQEMYRKTVNSEVYSSETIDFDLEFILKVPSQMPEGAYRGTICLEAVSI